MSIFGSIKQRARQLALLQGHPKALALGSSLGVFMGIMPIMPFRLIMITLLAYPLRANLLAAVIVATIVANPIAIPLWYLFAFSMGNILLSSVITMESLSGLLSSLQSADNLWAGISSLADFGYDAVLVLLIGGASLALPCGALTYILGLRYFMARAAKRQAPD